MDDYEYDKYVTTVSNIKNTIHRYGVAILPNVLNELECNEIISGLWNYFEFISKEWTVPINRNDNSTWNQIYNLLPLHSMLFQYFESGHAEISWKIRTNPKIINIFGEIWETNDLLVSFDGFSFNCPPEITKRCWNKNNTWYHVDQSFTRNNFECIQSWVTGLDVRRGDATLAFLESSNRYHEEFAKYYNITDKKDWYKLTKEQEQFYTNKNCIPKKIMCPAGSLVFWDSRTVHCGSEAIKERKNIHFRAVIYLCYMPRILCTENNLKKKKNAFDNQRTCNHNPCKIKLFPKYPRIYGRVLPTHTNIKKPILTDTQLKLAGF